MTILKKIILLILMMTLGLLADESKWKFTTEDLSTMSDEQREILSMARQLGDTYGLGDTLVYIAGVETRFGEEESKTNTHCGVMQISKKYARTTCKVLKDNLYLNMMLAIKNLKYWLDVHDGNMRKALVAYNGGYKDNPHGKEYLRRIDQVKYALKRVERYGDKIT